MTTRIVVTCDICEKEISPANSYTVVSPLVHGGNELNSYAKYFNLCSIECLAAFSQSIQLGFLKNE